MSKRSRTEYSLINIMVGMGGYFFNTILGFICRMVFVKCLPAEYLGINGIIYQYSIDAFISGVRNWNGYCICAI